MVTPITAAGRLDEPAVGRIVDYLCNGGVHGVFVLGTTGEGSSVPGDMRDRLVQLTLESVHDRVMVYAGVSANSLPESVAAGNEYLRLGVDAVVAHVPAHFEQRPQAALEFYSELENQLRGDLVLYNMPLTTNVSLSIELCKETARRPRVIGIKDSENDAVRMMELLRELGGRKDFFVFIGTGPLMAKGLLLGADGIVPSVGNIAPALCRELYDSATSGDVAVTEKLHEQLMKVSGVYQNGRQLGHSLAALKAAMSWLGLCGTNTLPPLNPVSETERCLLRDKLVALDFPVCNPQPDEDKTRDWTDDGRPGGSRAGALRSSPFQP
ncbi:MAG: dihydrodipicolinate synthase family protein [Verrucomicrobia bacterium]|nr:dihydrodipicolinate synthase family protein [Verrucomicrobiota bacterium]